MSNPRKKLKNSLSLIIILMIIVYGFFQSKDLLRGPIIEVEYPLDGTTLQGKVVEVKGEAKNIAYINLNDRQIFVDNEGIFSETIIAPSGYSTIKLSARDKFGETEEKLIKVYLAEESPPLEDLFYEEEVLEEETEEGINEENINTETI
jgi:hypothetical protein